ncbi:MAG: isoprenylcysteine carboxylmethyltransferase family protein [Bacteroidetes bacterium]|nr:MAG: isoprenylcysteine carboxylmethyltransferase family protein [Bacteroidota bacterium]
MPPLLTFAFALAGYYALHSLLADHAVKTRLQTFLPFRYYRLFFNALSIGLLVPLYRFYAALPPEKLSDFMPLTVAGWVLFILGVGWLLAAMSGYDAGEFTGIYQWKHNAPPRHTALKTTGLNGIVRHPLYLGTFLIAWGLFGIRPEMRILVIAVVTSLYLIVGIRLEEKKLVREFGEAYRAYQKSVPMLFPFKGF